MGVEYFVACRQCKVRRDLDKFYTMLTDVPDRVAALEFRDEIARDSFRAGLLVSFMWKHREHDCFVCSEHEDYIWDDFTNEEVNFWRDDGKLDDD